MKVNCGWCRSEELDKISFAICANCLVRSGGINHSDFSSLEREFVDTLPYGTIVIDKNDTITSYNLTEAKITGMKPDDVEGKNFFKDIAPCTAVKEFQGRVNEMREKGEDSQISIEFTFNHKNFSAFVSILFTFYKQADYTIINVQQLEAKKLK